MGRRPSHRSTSAEAAREYLAKRWGHSLIVVEGIVGHYGSRLSQATEVARVNGLLDRFRELGERVASLRPPLTMISATAKEVAPWTVCDLEGGVREVVDAVDRLEARVRPLAENVMVAGGSDELRGASEAHEKYKARPGARTREALSAALRTHTLDNLRAEIIRRAVDARPALAKASEFEWAYFEIAAGLDAPCDPDTFGTHRRDRWREARRRALKTGGRGRSVPSPPRR